MAPASLGSLHARFSLEFPAPMSFCKPAVPAGWSILESCPRISTPSICLTDHFHHVYCLDETFLSDSPQSLHLLSECPALTLRKHTRDCVLWILWLAPSPMKLARKKKKSCFSWIIKLEWGKMQTKDGERRMEPYIFSLCKKESKWIPYKQASFAPYFSSSICIYTGLKRILSILSYQQTHFYPSFLNARCVWKCICLAP